MMRQQKETAFSAAPLPSAFRCGFAALLGRPNVGKSTLVNRLVGHKVAIVSPKAQTTRSRILGLLHEPHAQTILVDTPGVVAGAQPLPKALRRLAKSAACDADVVVLLVAVRPGECRLTEADEAVLALARKSAAAPIVALNKVDLLPNKRLLLPWMQTWAQAHPAEAVVPLSARTGEGVDTLRRLIAERLPVGPALFDAGMHTDQAERVLCAELVREQMLLRLADEVPHSVAVFIEQFDDERDSERPICRLWGRIVVEREGQKAIVIGQGGRMLKAIGQAARRHLEDLLGAQVYLRLQVKVDAKWTQRADALTRYGVGPSP